MRITASHHVLVLGLGESGMACVRWCAHVGAKLRVADTREQPPELGKLQSLAPNAEFVSGAFNLSLLDGIDVVLRSPGLSPVTLKALKTAAQERGIAWLAELDVFTAALDELRDARGYQPKVIAITGTNGKTTVTSICGLLANHARKKAVTAGNISPAMLDVLCDELQAQELNLPDVWCLELSSFQLDDVLGFNPDAATVLNITQDHGDWHPDMPHYAQAKSRIFGDKTICVLNRDDPAVMALATQLPSTAQVVSFGLDMPSHVGDYGLETTGSFDWLVRAQIDETVDQPKRIGRGKTAKPPAPLETVIQRIMPAEALKIRGKHNQANALASLALLTAIDLPLAPMLHALREYAGEPHRVELVATRGGVDYIDDSKGTNVGATVAALQGLGRKVVLIVGGVGKGQDFSPLAAPVREYANTVITIGESASIIQASLCNTAIPIIHSETLEDAVAKAAEVAHAGEVVLLSPACASFDMFRNYEHRAQVFKDAVHALPDLPHVTLVQGAQA